MREKRMRTFTCRLSFSTKILSLIVLGLLLATSCRKEVGFDRITPINAPFAMPQLQRPIFPNRAFDIRDYGAVADTMVKNTGAFKKAIAACSKAGGGRVLVPKGIWLTGAIHLKSNVNLHLDKDAEIRFSQNPDDYLPVVSRRRGQEFYSYSSFIYARDCENIAVTGEGLLNGQGQAFYKLHWKNSDTEANAVKFLREAAANDVPPEQRILDSEKAAIRPCFIEPVNCKNVLLEGFRITNSPAWTINLVYCENVIARKITAITKGPNVDGIDINSSKNVLVEYCYFSTGDDAVAIKSGRDEDGWRVGKPSENIVIRHCRITDEYGGHGRIAIGSEMSGNVRNVYIHDCYFKGTNLAINIKSKRGRGGIVEHVWVKNITAEKLSRGPVINLTTFYGFGKKWLEVKSLSTKPPLFRDLHFENISCAGASEAVRVVGLPEKFIRNLSFRNIDIQADSGFTCIRADSVELDNINISAKQGVMIHLTDSKNVRIANSECPENTPVGLKVDGLLSENILLGPQNFRNAVKRIEMAPDAPKGAVVIAN